MITESKKELQASDANIKDSPRDFIISWCTVGPKSQISIYNNGSGETLTFKGAYESERGD